MVRLFRGSEAMLPKVDQNKASKVFSYLPTTKVDWIFEV